MSAPKPASWAYAEEFVPEDEVARGAPDGAGRSWARQPGGHRRGRRAALARRRGRARAVVEIGTGAGTSGLWLLRGHARRRRAHDDRRRGRAPARGQARRSPRPASAHQRTRVITGRALDVLPRLTDGAYDLVVIDADKDELPRLRRARDPAAAPGGVLAVDNVLWHDKVADPARRDETTTHAARPRQDAARRRRAASRPCCRSATACWSPSSAEPSGDAGPGPRRKPAGPLGDRHDLEGLDQRRRRADDRRCRPFAAPWLELRRGTRRGSCSCRRRRCPRTTRPRRIRQVLKARPSRNMNRAIDVPTTYSRKLLGRAVGASSSDQRTVSPYPAFMPSPPASAAAGVHRSRWPPRWRPRCRRPTGPCPAMSRCAQRRLPTNSRRNSAAVIEPPPPTDAARSG